MSGNCLEPVGAGAWRSAAAVAVIVDLPRALRPGRHGGPSCTIQNCGIPGNRGEMAVLVRMTAAGMDAATYDQASAQLAGLVKSSLAS
jgi:hypothetical protein